MAISEANSLTSWVKKLNAILLLVALVTVVNSGIKFAKIISDEKPAFVPTATSNQPSIPFLTPQAIADMHLFGLSGNAMTEIDGNPRQGSSGNLTLKGVVVQDNTASSGAFIAERNQPEAFYKINEALPGNATLHAVFPNYVLVKRNERLEALSFPDENSPGITDIEPASGNTKFGNNTNYAQFTKLPPDETTTARKMSDSELAEVYKNKFKANPEITMNEVGIKPVAVGKTEGYKITGEGKSAEFIGAGLKKDDIILSVDGQKIGNLEKDKSLVDKISLDKKPSLEIKRGNSIFVITYSPK